MESYEEWVVKIRFVSNIPRGNKLGVNDMSYHKANSWIDAFKRYYHGEDFNGTDTYLSSLIDEAEEFYKTLPAKRSQIRKCLSELIPVLNRLAEVYTPGNPQMVARLQVKQEKILQFVHCPEQPRERYYSLNQEEQKGDSSDESEAEPNLP